MRNASSSRFSAAQRSADFAKSSRLSAGSWAGRNKELPSNKRQTFFIGSSGHGNDRFNNSSLRFEPVREVIDHLVERRLMSDPRAGINSAFFDQLNDAAELVRQCIARSE